MKSGWGATLAFSSLLGSLPIPRCGLHGWRSRRRPQSFSTSTQSLPRTCSVQSFGGSTHRDNRELTVPRSPKFTPRARAGPPLPWGFWVVPSLRAFYLL